MYQYYITINNLTMSKTNFNQNFSLDGILDNPQLPIICYENETDSYYEITCIRPINVDKNIKIPYITIDITKKLTIEKE